MATPLSRPAPGGAFAFSVVVTNTSDVPVTIRPLLDNVYGDSEAASNTLTRLLRGGPDSRSRRAGGAWSGISTATGEEGPAEGEDARCYEPEDGGQCVPGALGGPPTQRLILDVGGINVLRLGDLVPVAGVVPRDQGVG